MMIDFSGPQANLWFGQQFRPESGGEDFPIVDASGRGTRSRTGRDRSRGGLWVVVFLALWMI